MSDTGLSRKYLDELRLSYTRGESHEGRIIHDLLDEVDALDDALRASEDEVESLRERFGPEEAEQGPAAVSGSVAGASSGKWRVRWRDASGRQYSKSFDRKNDARHFLADAKHCSRGGDR
ncbi:hypothetical protein ACIQOW_03525 [Kitasatospora sp. NPDC091335]|uniref:hypothetical protein n=1 Tax=Kitasatospora sp. NPDC091335 TaxID=3364085 RepID=UPI0037FFA488